MMEEYSAVGPCSGIKRNGVGLTWWLNLANTVPVRKAHEKTWCLCEMSGAGKSVEAEVAWWFSRLIGVGESGVAC